jgi:hypothetical protein
MAKTEVPVAIVIRTTDKASAQIAQLTASIHARFKALGPGMAQVQAGFKGIGRELGDVATKLGIAAGAVGAIGLGVKHIFEGVADKADNFAKLSAKVGASIESLQELHYAADLSGANLEQLQGGMQKLAKAAEELTRGGKTAKNLFKELGIKATDATGKIRPTDELLMKVADRFAALPDGAKKTALAMRLFGRSGTDLIPFLNEGSSGIGKLRAEFVSLGGEITTDQARAFEQFNDDTSRVKVAIDGLKNQIAIALLPHLQGAATRLVEWAKANRELIATKVHEFVDKAVVAVKSFWQGLKDFAASMQPVVDLVRGFVDAVGGGANAVKLLVGAWLTFKALKIGSELVTITGGIWKMVTALKAAEVAGGGAGGGIVGALKKGGSLLATPGGAIVAGTAAATYLGVKYNRQLTAGLEHIPGVGHRLAETFRGGSGSSTGFAERVADLQKQGLGIEQARLTAAKLMRHAYKTTGKSVADLPQEARDALAADAQSQWAQRRAARRAQGTGPLASEAPVSAADMAQLIGALRALANGGISIDINNAPPGTKVEKKGATPIDLAVGYLLGAP